MSNELAISVTVWRAATTRSLRAAHSGAETRLCYVPVCVPYEPP